METMNLFKEWRKKRFYKMPMDRSKQSELSLAWTYSFVKNLTPKSVVRKHDLTVAVPSRRKTPIRWSLSLDLTYVLALMNTQQRNCAVICCIFDLFFVLDFRKNQIFVKSRSDRIWFSVSFAKIGGDKLMNVKLFPYIGTNFIYKI